MLIDANAAELAQYDQRRAESEDDLDQLINIYTRENLGEPEHYRLIGFIKALYDNVETEAMAEMLGLAILRLAAVGSEK